MTTAHTPAKAVVLLSGGLDSATVLAMAQSQGYQCYSVSFDYGQRHRFEGRVVPHLHSGKEAVHVHMNDLAHTKPVYKNSKWRQRWL